MPTTRHLPLYYSTSPYRRLHEKWHLSHYGIHPAPGTWVRPSQDSSIAGACRHRTSISTPCSTDSALGHEALHLTMAFLQSRYGLSSNTPMRSLQLLRRSTISSPAQSGRPPQPLLLRPVVSCGFPEIPSTSPVMASSSTIACCCTPQFFPPIIMIASDSAQVLSRLMRYC